MNLQYAFCLVIGLISSGCYKINHAEPKSGSVVPIQKSPACLNAAELKTYAHVGPPLPFKAVCDRLIGKSILRALNSDCSQVGEADLLHITKLNIYLSDLTSQSQSISPQDVQGLANVHDLTLSGVSIEASALSELGNSLRSLTLDGFDESKLPAGLLQSAPLLESLEINHYNGERLPDCFVAGLQKLNQMQIFDTTTLTSLPAFCDSPSLSSISLKFVYELESLPPDLLIGAPKLERLEFNEVPLRSLPDTLLANSSQLKTFSLQSDSNLHQIPSAFFSASPKLQNVVIESTSLDGIPAGLLANNSLLVNVDFSVNQIPEVPPLTFQGHPNLASVDLRNNKITHVEVPIEFPGAVDNESFILSLQGNSLDNPSRFSLAIYHGDTTFREPLPSSAVTSMTRHIFPTENFLALAVDQNIIYAVSDQGLFVSEDGGITFNLRDQTRAFALHDIKLASHEVILDIGKGGDEQYLCSKDSYYFSECKMSTSDFLWIAKQGFDLPNSRYATQLETSSATGGLLLSNSDHWWSNGGQYSSLETSFLPCGTIAACSGGFTSFLIGQTNRLWAAHSKYGIFYSDDWGKSFVQLTK